MLPPGTVIKGFRIERTIGTRQRGVVYEATQLNLGRSVAFTVLAQELSTDAQFAERFRQQTWSEHPHLVPVYAVGQSRHGLFMASQLIRGETLAELIAQERLERAIALEALSGVAAALDAVHAADLAHGSVTADAVLVDRRGRGWLSDLGLAPPNASPAGDRVAFTQLVRACLGDDVALADDPATSAGAVARAAQGGYPPETRSRRHGRRGRWCLAAALVGVLAAVASLVIVQRGAERRNDDSRVLGSTLAAGGTRSLGCDGRPPTVSSPQCTVLQTRLEGRRLTAPTDGLIRGWTVRGARGELALQVIRPRGKSYVQTARSQTERAPDEGTHTFPARLGIRRGQRLGLAVAPGATVGVRRSASNASTVRWFRRPTFLPPRSAMRRGGFEHEILFQAEFVPNATPRLPASITGRAAGSAPPGTQLETATVRVGHRRYLCLALVRLRGEIAIDYTRTKRHVNLSEFPHDLCRNRARERAGRLEVPDAHPRGSATFFGRELPPFDHTVPELRPPELSMFRLEWLNPNGRAIAHDYLFKRGRARLLN